MHLRSLFDAEVPDLVRHVVRVGDDRVRQFDSIVDRRVARLGLVDVVLPGQDLVLRLGLGGDLGLNPGIDPPTPENRKRANARIKMLDDGRGAKTR